jgi:hypothetical protein
MRQKERLRLARFGKPLRDFLDPGIAMRTPAAPYAYHAVRANAPRRQHLPAWTTSSSHSRSPTNAFRQVGHFSLTLLINRLARRDTTAYVPKSAVIPTTATIPWMVSLASSTYLKKGRTAQASVKKTASPILRRQLSARFHASGLERNSWLAASPSVPSGACEGGRSEKPQPVVCRSPFGKSSVTSSRRISPFPRDHGFTAAVGGGGSTRAAGEKMGVFSAGGLTAITMLPSHS